MSTKKSVVIFDSVDTMTATLKKVVEKVAEKTIEIKAAKLKDSFCNYSYELTTGPMAGDTCNRLGASIVHEDMFNAFARLNVHLAVICEEIDGLNIVDIDEIKPYDDESHNEDSIEYSISRFRTSAFIIDGASEKENVVLVGEKRLSTGDYVKLTTPKRLWTGDYVFINELRVAIDDLKIEVEAYMNGKTAPKYEQPEIGFDDNENSEGDE